MCRKGENIFKRKDGRWEARYVKGRDPSGRIRYGFCYARTYREAKSKVAQIKAALLTHQSIPSAADRKRLSFFCDEWLQVQSGRVRESTIVKYDCALRCHILPALGDSLPSALTTPRVEAFKQDLLAQGLSAQSVRNTLMVLHAVLRYASAQYPGVFPAAEIRYPRSAQREPRVLSEQEQERFVAYLLQDMDACRFGILLALSTGLRIGEVCALRWSQISPEQGTLRVAATMQRLRDMRQDGTGKTKIVIGSPKSDTSARTIPLPGALATLCASFDPHCPDAYVLTGTERLMEPRTLQRRLARYTEACGLAGVHFHTLRHTFATRCMENGFEIKSLSQIMGHARTATTLDRYVHASMALRRSNMEKLTRIFAAHAQSGF